MLNREGWGKFFNRVVITEKKQEKLLVSHLIQEAQEEKLTAGEFNIYHFVVCQTMVKLVC